MKKTLYATTEMIGQGDWYYMYFETNEEAVTHRDEGWMEKSLQMCQIIEEEEYDNANDCPPLGRLIPLKIINEQKTLKKIKLEITIAIDRVKPGDSSKALKAAHEIISNRLWELSYELNELAN